MERPSERIRRREFLTLGGVSLAGLASDKVWAAEKKTAATTQAIAEGTVVIQALNGTWQLATDPQNVGQEQKWFNAGPVVGAQVCQVPDILERTFPGYDGVVWYWKEFETEVARQNERLLLKFHAADYLADVWVNGTHVGSHEGGETPFSLAVTREVRGRRENRLVVRVLNPSNEPIDGLTLDVTPHGIKNIPMSVGNFWNPGGLWQPVELLRVPLIRVAQIFADASLSDEKIVIEVSVANDTGATERVTLHCEVTPASGGPAMVARVQRIEAPAGVTIQHVELAVPKPRPWSPDDPYLYRLTVRLESRAGSHAESVRCGFREFVFRDGYFRLNGKRIFLRSTHGVGHYPIGQHAADLPELLRRELIYAKGMGFNTVRWLGRTMFPSQLDFCDELGLMVYQESYASWRWKDSAEMKERFDHPTREMILRDRNHPALVIWGLLNETRDGAIFRHACDMLPLVRSLDPSRMVLLGSGRWDGQWSIGSLSNPHTSEWEYALGEEAPGASSMAGKEIIGGYVEGSGDAHMYVPRPWRKEDFEFFRTVGAKSKNVFLSEHGNGSQIDPVRITRLFEQHGARPDMDDAKLYRATLDQLEVEWKRWGLDQVFTTPSEMVLQGQKIHSEQRLIALNAIRSNPKLCGYSMTGICDQGVEGEGTMTTFRELKMGAVDAITDGFAPVRWCLFVEPVHLYRGATVHVEAVLANEDVLKPGDYPVRLRIVGPSGVACDKAATLNIPNPNSSREPPMVFPVFKEDVRLEGPAGNYEIGVFFERGAAPLGRQTVIVGDATLQPTPAAPVTVWDDSPELSSWLVGRGGVVTKFEPAQTPDKREIVLIGGRSGSQFLGDAAAYRALMERVARGSVAVFLAPEALGTHEDPLAYLPVAQKGKLEDSAGYFWGRDDIVRPHPIFAGLPSRCVMDLTFYRDVVPYKSFTGMDQHGEVVVPCFALGHPGTQGYWSAANMVSYPFGEGKVIVSTLRLLENIGSHPAADRIILNLLTHASGDTGKPLAALPADFTARLDP